METSRRLASKRVCHAPRTRRLQLSWCSCKSIAGLPVVFSTWAGATSPRRVWRDCPMRQGAVPRCARRRSRRVRLAGVQN